jgi:uncharacterized membrane protein
VAGCGNLWVYIQSVIDWAHIHQAWVGGLSLLSVITFIATLLIIPMMVIKMPEEYFLYDKSHLKEFRRQHPIIRFFSVIFKNILGMVFIVAGVVMLILPGQGVLTILIGFTLVNFPRKRALERRVIQNQAVHKAVNWIRAKAGKPPVKVPERSHR